MRELGLNPANGGTTRAIRRRAKLLGIDSSHFRNNRSWSDTTLREVIAESRTWDEALIGLGLSPRAGGSRALVQAHTLRLEIDIGHLGRRAPLPATPSGLVPYRPYLRHAAESLAAAWFALCGCEVAFPMIPSAHDLLVTTSDGIQRVQVKTTTHTTREGWIAQIGRRPYSLGKNAPRIPYDPELIDLFFIVDGDLTMYLIPCVVVAGRQQILLRAYTKYVVGNVAGIMGSRSAAA
jgi:hypothetical protein